VTSFSLFWLTVVENAQIVSNALAPPATISAAAQSDTSGSSSSIPRPSMEALCASLHCYKQLLEALKITKGRLKGQYKCWHCKANKIAQAFRPRTIQRIKLADFISSCTLGIARG
jgi:hypothetical protein